LKDPLDIDPILISSPPNVKSLGSKLSCFFGLFLQHAELVVIACAEEKTDQRFGCRSSYYLAFSVELAPMTRTSENAAFGIPFGTTSKMSTAVVKRYNFVVDLSS
jgi:hypothetical protein